MLQDAFGYVTKQPGTRCFMEVRGAGRRCLLMNGIAADLHLSASTPCNGKSACALNTLHELLQSTLAVDVDCLQPQHHSTRLL